MKENSKFTPLQRIQKYWTAFTSSGGAMKLLDYQSLFENLVFDIAYIVNVSVQM